MLIRSVLLTRFLIQEVVHTQHVFLENNWFYWWFIISKYLKKKSYFKLSNSLIVRS